MRWRKEQSISWQGGSITAAYGNLVQTWFTGGNSMIETNAVEIDRAS